MIAVDSSVWIDFLRGRITPEAQLLGSLVGVYDLIVGDPVLCEVLRGAETDEGAGTLETLLREFDIEVVTSDYIAVMAAANYRLLRARGVTIRSTVDLLVGTWCIERDYQLLHRDRDFDAMEQHLGLRVLHA